MEQIYSFDIVHDAQSVFRKLLRAFANPFQAETLTAEAGGFTGKHRVLLAIGSTLMDNEVSFYVEKNTGLCRELKTCTLAENAPYQKADYIFLTGALNYENIRNLFTDAKQGSLEDPQQSATFIIWCDSFSGSEQIECSGPGIDGRKTMLVSEYIKKICILRQEIQQEYPCGIDLLFVSSNDEIMAWPRLCRVR